MVYPVKKDFVPVHLASNGTNPIMDGNLGVVRNYDVVAGIRSVFVVHDMTPVRDEVIGSTKINT
jgi:hypothetical protein